MMLMMAMMMMAKLLLFAIVLSNAPAARNHPPNAHPMGKSQSNESGEVDTLAVLGPTLLA